VLLNDAEAEHLPGCNLAIRKAALVRIGGFRPAFTTAGDDVDICWRLRAGGGRLDFVPGAMVWHRRRFSVRAYLRQQRGYGKAEALLIREHPQHFGIVGGARWSGAIYGDSAPGSLPEEGAIFHGPLGYGLFQRIYAQGVTGWLDRLGGVAWMAPSLACFLLGAWAAGLALIVWSFLLAVCRLRRLPTSPFDLSPKDNVLLLFLCWSQPIVRESARLLGMIRLRALPSCRPNLTEVFTPHRPRKWTLRLDEFAFWSETGMTRDHWVRALQALLASEGLPFRLDDGWRWFDVEVNPDGLVSPAVISVTEYHHAQGRLTRIRLLVRVRRWLFASLAATMILLSVLLAPQPRLLLLTMLGALCLIGASAIVQRAAIRRWILRAAKDCGLEIVNHRS
jgi:hypothetical protein